MREGESFSSDRAKEMQQDCGASSVNGFAWPCEGAKRRRGPGPIHRCGAEMPAWHHLVPPGNFSRLPVRGTLLYLPDKKRCRCES